MTSEEHRRLYKRSGKNAFEIHLIAKDTLNRKYMLLLKVEFISIKM